jgi:hypothetical protein
MRKLSIITLGVSDLDISAKFYELVLGLKRTNYQSGEIVFYNMDGPESALFPKFSSYFEKHPIMVELSLNMVSQCIGVDFLAISKILMDIYGNLMQGLRRLLPMYMTCISDLGSSLLLSLNIIFLFIIRLFIEYLTR